MTPSSWPLSSDFSRMLQKPQFAFRDPALRQCAVEMDALGQPKARSGNFATVYRGYRPDGTELAIRTFNRRADQRRERYQVVAEYLAKNPVSTIVHFQYDEQGIRSAADSKLYPLLTMDWVSGVTLYEWTRDRCRENYHEALALGAEAWYQLVDELIENKVVHGDLQHGNVLVDQSGCFKLVDYDCMAVPKLMDQPNLEIGLIPYQHPQRNERTLLYPGLDNFSALVIYVALRVLAFEPELWETYVEKTGYDKLLFRKEDFDNPAGSPLYRHLITSDNTQIRTLVGYLFQLYRCELHQVPTLEEAVLLCCHTVEELIEQRNFDRAVWLADRLGPAGRLAPAILPQVEEVRRRVQAKRDLEAALESGNETMVQRCYVRELLDDYPAAAELVEKARQSRQVQSLLDILQAAQRLQSWDMFRDTWKANQPLLAKRASAKPFKYEMQRLVAVENLRKMLERPNSDDALVQETWEHLQALGGHPTAEPFTAHVELRIARQRHFKRFSRLLEKAPNQADPEFDRRLLNTWREEMFVGWKKTASWIAIAQGARQRVEALEQAGPLLAQEMTLEREKALARLAEILPPGYEPSIEQPLRIAQKRVRAYAKLHESLRPPASDNGIAEAWMVLKETGAKSLLSEKVRKRIKLAEKRAPLLKRLDELTDEMPDYEIDRRLLEIWDDPLLEKCPDAEVWKPRFDLAVQRRDLLAELDDAVAEFNARRIERLLADPLLEDFTLSPERTESVRGVHERLKQQREKQKQSLLSAIRSGGRSAFCAEFDRSIVREILSEMPQHEAVVTQWIEEELLTLYAVGLAAEESAGGPHCAEENVYEMTWRWPEEHISDRCVLALFREPPQPMADPASQSPLTLRCIDRSQWESLERKTRLTIEQPEWYGASAHVCAVIDLGRVLLYSQSLDLGRIESPKKERRWGLFGG